MSKYISSCLLLISALFCLIKGSPTNENCVFTLVESIPENLTFNAGSHLSLTTYAAHKRLIGLAKKEIHLSSFYWSLRGSDVKYSDKSSYQGEDIFKSLKDAQLSKKIVLKIAQNQVNNDTELLSQVGAKVRTLNFTELVGAGILHTKMWIVDGKHMYVGSANFDWRSYTQVKELGILIENCQEIVSDADKIFDVYWYLGQPNVTIPKPWPASYSTSINETSPLVVNYNNSKGQVFLSSSPPPFCPSGRTTDINAILHVIYSAKEYIYISVMDYLPLVMYIPKERFWPIIDDALRKVAIEKKIKVYLMAGCWEHTRGDMFIFLKTLNDLQAIKNLNIVVKYFKVPIYSRSQAKIPYARVNHAKFMVTDQHAYIGTSNWSGDYFISTGGVGFVLAQGNGTVSDSGLRDQLKDIFLRDWMSKYSHYYCATKQVS